MSTGFDHINPPSKRNPARGRFFTDLAKGQNANRITGGKGILVSQTGSGVTISAKDVATGKKTKVINDETILAKISGTSLGGGLQADLYANGLGRAKTGTSKVYATNLAIDGRIVQSQTVIASYVQMDSITEIDEELEDEEPEV